LSTVSALLESEWRQGTVLPHRLLPEGTLPSSATIDTKLVVISHDCDLVNPKYEAEPFVEFFVARLKPSSDRNGVLFNGKNPRKLQFLVQENGEERLYEIDAREKYRADRRILEKGTRDKTIRISQENVRGIAKWAGRRYSRPSLPTAFQDRIPPSVEKKLRKKLERDGEEITGVYVGFNTLEELEVDKPYRIVLYVAVPPEVCEEDAKERGALGVVGEIRKLLSQCEGIEVEDADLRSESEITLRDLKRLIRWDFDYLSPEEETDLL
jgi:hypothetical protein